MEGNCRFAFFHCRIYNFKLLKAVKTTACQGLNVRVPNSAFCHIESKNCILPNCCIYYTVMKALICTWCAMKAIKH